MSHHRACCCGPADEACCSTGSSIVLDASGVDSSICSSCHGSDVIINSIINQLNVDGSYTSAFVSTGHSDGGRTYCKYSTLHTITNGVRATTYDAPGCSTTHTPSTNLDSDSVSYYAEIFDDDSQVRAVLIQTHGTNIGTAFIYDYSATGAPTYYVGDAIDNGYTDDPLWGCGLGAGNSYQNLATGGTVTITGCS